MKADEVSESASTILVENVGGIDRASVSFSPGITILKGRNASNRTSLLQGLMAALGSDRVSLKADADEAHVELDLDGTTYTRHLSRRDGSLTTEGKPYLDDAELADLFAFLVESNEARQAVARGDDLRDLIMRPIDTDAIQAEIQRNIEERQEIERQLENIEELKRQLPELEQQRTRLTQEIEDTREALAAKERELETADADLEETRQQRAEFEESLDDLQAKRSRLEDVRFDLETERESLDQLKQERQELNAELDNLPETDQAAVDELESRISRLRERKQTLETEVNNLQSVIGFNEELLDTRETAVFTGLSETDTSSASVTDELLQDEEVTCWTCGSEVPAERIEATLDDLRETSQTKVAEITTIETELDEAQQRRRELDQALERREDIDRRLDELATEIDETKTRIESLQETRDELIADIESIEAALEDHDDDEFGEVLDLHKEANQLEYELGSLETELDQIDDEIETVETQIAQESELERQRENVRAQIEELRTKIQRIEEDAIDQFNTHMDTVLTLLEYDNLDRVWLERVQREKQVGRGTETTTAFELHVVRTTESGTAYEDTVDHLSESEREVTGLVFALAGYLAHELHQELPIMLLDSLEAIDPDRIAALVEYLDDYTDYLFVALLPEDAAALADDHHRITDI